MPYELTRVKATNFRSFRELDFSPDRGVTFLFGENRDAGGAESNGSGKSSVVKAVSWCLTGQTDRGLDSKGYLRAGEDSCEVTVELHSAHLDRTVTVRRSVGAKSAVKMTVEVDGSPQGDLYDVKAAEAWLTEQLGISKQDLLDYFFIDSANASSFLGASDTEKKALISRIGGFDFLDARLEYAKRQRARLADEVDAMRTAEVKRTAEVDYLKRDTAEPVDLGAVRARYAYADEKARRSQSAYEAADHTESPDPPRAPVDDAERALRAAEADLRERLDLTKRLKQLNRRRSDLMSILDANEIECSKCAHVNDIDPEVQRVNRAALAEVVGDLEDVASALELTDPEDVLTKRTAECEESLKRAREEYKLAVAESRRGADELAELRAESVDAAAQLRIAKAELESAEARAAQRDERLERLRELTETSAEATAKLERRDALRGRVDYFAKALAPGGSFRSFLSRKALKAIELAVNDTLATMQIDLSVEVSGFTESKTGKVSDKIDVSVVDATNRRRGFASLSGGQRARLNVCGALATARLFNSAMGVEGLNLLVFDEALDAMDAKGLRETENILSRSGVNSVIVSHVVDSSVYGKAAKVVYEAGESRIEC